MADPATIAAVDDMSASCLLKILRLVWTNAASKTPAASYVVFTHVDTPADEDCQHMYGMSTELSAVCLSLPHAKEVARSLCWNWTEADETYEEFMEKAKETVHKTIRSSYERGTDECAPLGGDSFGCLGPSVYCITSSTKPEGISTCVQVFKMDIIKPKGAGGFKAVFSKQKLAPLLWSKSSS